MISISNCALSEAEIEAAVRVMRSGHLRQGAEVAAFEDKFAEQVGAHHVVACSSGTAALHLAYLTRFAPGDEVLVPALTFLATASMVLAVGAVPVCVDVDPDTWLIDLADAEQRITPRTRGIVPVHLFGNPCDPKAVGDFAERHGLTIVWDAAQAHGAIVSGLDVGALGGTVCYSLYATKNLFLGEGGLICTPSQRIADHVRRLRQHGIGDDGVCREPGYNYRMTDIAAAIGRKQLDRFDAMVAARRTNAAELRARLGTIPGLHLQRVTSGATSAWHHFCCRVDPAEFGVTRDELATMLASAGIQTAVHYPRVLHEHPVMPQQSNSPLCTVASQLTRELLAIPVHHELGRFDIDKVVSSVSSCHRTRATQRAVS